jgi:ATP-dependent DNA helicase RecQ
MKKFTANYSNTHSNFVIQNLPDKRISDKYLPAVCIIKNLLQRGNPALPSKYLESFLGDCVSSNPSPLISHSEHHWDRIIRGDDVNSFNPAQLFYDNLIPKYFPEFPFMRQLLLPEVPINTITQFDVAKFVGKQVDFYLPQVFLVLEIDGSQHDRRDDALRDAHLAKFGVKTIRIPVVDVVNETPAFLEFVNAVHRHIRSTTEKLNHRKQDYPHLYTLDDYAYSYQQQHDFGKKEHVASAIMRLQITLLELIEAGTLSLDHDWDIGIVCDELPQFESYAFDDIMLWFKNILKLHRIQFTQPQLSITRYSSLAELKGSPHGVLIDLSIWKRYTDLNQSAPEVVFVRSDYFEFYRYYKKASSETPSYVGLKPYDYFRLSTAPQVDYHIQLGGSWNPESALEFLLDNIFGYPKFNQGQLPIIVSALSRNDTIGLLPTGGGKSICYQLPALLQPAVSFVVSPIKSLMYDQKQDLLDSYITRINHATSDDDSEEKEAIMADFAQGKYFFLFISPERFQTKAFREHLKAVELHYQIAFAVIDEVHCLSEWGHDFRTSYLNLAKTIRKYCQNFRFLGLTATASVNVLKDIQIEFGIKKENIKTLVDFTRRELEFNVMPCNDSSLEELTNMIQVYQSEHDVLASKGNDSRCGIVFTQTVNGRRGCYRVSQELEKYFHTPVRFYSGKVPKANGSPVMNTVDFEKYKRDAQNEFKRNETTLLCATKAFGMGVNKGNIHYTIHLGMPSSMEALYQEAGRAGRDKKRFEDEKAICTVLFRKTNNADALNLIWERSTSISDLKALNQSNSVDGDISTNLFMFQKDQYPIDDEQALISNIVLQTAVSGKKVVRLEAGKLKTDKASAERALYRLSQLGVVEDWTVTDWFSGVFEVDFSVFTEQTMKANLKATINKYDPEFDFSKISRNLEYKEYYSTLNSAASVSDRCIRMLLEWVYNHFAYKRRQSLKNIYESCLSLAENSTSKDEFRTKLEEYFRHSETSFLLGHVAEKPDDVFRWFDLFYQNDEKKADEILNWEQRQALLASVSRFLESYQYNTGLDFISGVVRLLVDDYDNPDGRDRLESAMERVVDMPNSSYVIDSLLLIGQQMSTKSKQELAKTILRTYNEDSEMIRKICLSLEDDYSSGLYLTLSKNRIQTLNQDIYELLAKIG